MPAPSAVPAPLLAAPEVDPAAPMPAGTPAIDISALTSVFGDEGAAVAEILAAFVDPTREIVADIRAGMAAQNTKTVTRAAHKLKSSARTVGAVALAHIAIELERAGKAEDWPALSLYGDALAPAFDDVAAFIARFADGGQVGEEAIDQRVLHDTFGGDERIIREIMADFIGPARTSMTEIEQAHAVRSADGVATAACTLKLSARAVGAQNLADACQTLEHAGRAHEWDDIDAGVAGLAATFEAVASHIRAHKED
jgi:HPt (histidine-containing phosphotransfer) domain-containing protein